MGIKNNRLIFEMEFDILEKNKNPINNNGKDAKKIQIINQSVTGLYENTYTIM